MPENLGAAYGMRSTRKQDPTSHFQPRPNGPMTPGGPNMQGPWPGLSGGTKGPGGGGFVGTMPTVGGTPKYQPRVGQGGVGQPGGMIPPGGYPRNGGVPGGGFVSGGTKSPRPRGGGYDGSGINPGGGIMNPRPTPGMNSGGGIMNPRPTSPPSGPIMAPPSAGGPRVGGGKQPRPLGSMPMPKGGGTLQPKLPRVKR